jgi:hypothetical protein
VPALCALLEPELGDTQSCIAAAAEAEALRSEATGAIVRHNQVCSAVHVQRAVQRAPVLPLFVVHRCCLCTTLLSMHPVMTRQLVRSAACQPCCHSPALLVRQQCCSNWSQAFCTHHTTRWLQVQILVDALVRRLERQRCRLMAGAAVQRGESPEGAWAAAALSHPPASLTAGFRAGLTRERRGGPLGTSSQLQDTCAPLLESPLHAGCE